LVSIYKAALSVYLFVCPIITQEPLDRFVSNFGWGTGGSQGNVLSLVKENSKLNRLTFKWNTFFQAKFLR